MYPYGGGRAPYGGSGGFGGMGGYGDDYGAGDYGSGDDFFDWTGGDLTGNGDSDLLSGATYGGGGTGGRYGNFPPYGNDFDYNYGDMRPPPPRDPNPWAGGYGHDAPQSARRRYDWVDEPARREDLYMSGALPSEDDPHWVADRNDRRARDLQRYGDYDHDRIGGLIGGELSGMTGGNNTDGYYNYRDNPYARYPPRQDSPAPDRSGVLRDQAHSPHTGTYYGNRNPFDDYVGRSRHAQPQFTRDQFMQDELPMDTAWRRDFSLQAPSNGDDRWYEDRGPVYESPGFFDEDPRRVRFR